jgi:hypothetical protein
MLIYAVVECFANCRWFHGYWIVMIVLSTCQDLGYLTSSIAVCCRNAVISFLYLIIVQNRPFSYLLLCMLLLLASSVYVQYFSMISSPPGTINKQCQVVQK